MDNSKALYYFPFYVKDWLSSRSVKRMTLAQKGAYIELLATQWLDGSLPNDEDELASILGATESEFAKVWKRVEPMFPVCQDGQRRNEKLDDLREKALEKSEKASESVRRRWAKSNEVEPKNDTNVLPTHNDRNTNDIPYKKSVINNQESVIKDSSLSAADTARKEDLWTEFLSIYPKRNGDRNVAQGKKKFMQIATLAKAPEIMEGVKRYAAFCDSAGKTGTVYVAQITTWLNGERWNETYDLTPAKVAPVGKTTAEQLQDRKAEILRQLGR